MSWCGGRDQLRFKVETQDSVGPMEFTNLIVLRGRRKGLSLSRISQARIGPFLVFEMPSGVRVPPPAPQLSRLLRSKWNFR